MKKICFLLIIGLLISACTSSAAEAPPTLTPVPLPTSTPIPPTPIPNPDAEEALITFCESIMEGDVEKALLLFTEEPRIYRLGFSYFGLSGVEDLVKDFSSDTEYFCEVKDFEFNGDVVEFSWNDRSIYQGDPEGILEVKCKCTAYMFEEKIDKLDCDCSWEITPFD